MSEVCYPWSTSRSSEGMCYRIAGSESSLRCAWVSLSMRRTCKDVRVISTAKAAKEYWDGEKAVIVALEGSTVMLPCVNRNHIWTERHSEEEQQVVHWDRQPPGVPHDRADRLIDLYASGERRSYGPLFIRQKMNITDTAFALGDFSLRISELENADEGTYSCHLHHHYCGLHERRIYQVFVTEPVREKKVVNLTTHNTAPAIGEWLLAVLLGCRGGRECAQGKPVPCRSTTDTTELKVPLEAMLGLPVWFLLFEPRAIPALKIRELDEVLLPSLTTSTELLLSCSHYSGVPGATFFKMFVRILWCCFNTELHPEQSVPPTRANYPACCTSVTSCPAAVCCALSSSAAHSALQCLNTLRQASCFSNRLPFLLTFMQQERVWRRGSVLCCLCCYNMPLFA